MLFYKLFRDMVNLTEYHELTYIYTYDEEVYCTVTKKAVIDQIINNKDVQFLNLWSESLNKSNIKKVSEKAPSDIDKILFSIDDRELREKVKQEIKEREKNWYRVNPAIIQNLILKFSND